MALAPTRSRLEQDRTRTRRRVLPWLPAIGLALALTGPVSAEPVGAPRPALGFADLSGWASDDHAAAFSAFRSTCRPGRLDDPALAEACAAALAVSDPTSEAARLFFERWFEPREVARDGFLTGYYEPELPGSLTPDAPYRVALLARPGDLVERSAGEVPTGWPEGRTAARLTATGYEPLPDRAAIEAGALGEAARPVVFLADPVDAFMVHVQGSARIRLPDGGTMRVGFDGRNGHPYTAIGRLAAEREGVPPADMDADRLVAWLKADPARAADIMAANRSFIFFRAVEAVAAEQGPVGAAGVPLTAGRSVAVDHAAWPYGTPVWLEGEVARPGGGSEPLGRLVVAQDTGAAIVGEARGDLFVGSGAEAGARAGLMRQRVRWVVLMPRASGRVAVTTPP